MFPLVMFWCLLIQTLTLKMSLNLSQRTVMATHKDRRRGRTPQEESYGNRSNVPCPGDTLPWNLSKHQWIKRSRSASGEVLDPAERAVIRIAGRMHWTIRCSHRLPVTKHKKRTFLEDVCTLLQTACLYQNVAQQNFCVSLWQNRYC